MMRVMTIGTILEFRIVGDRVDLEDHLGRTCGIQLMAFQAECPSGELLNIIGRGFFCVGQPLTMTDDAGKRRVYVIFDHFLHVPVTLHTHRFAGDPFFLGRYFIEGISTVVAILAE